MPSSLLILYAERLIHIVIGLLTSVILARILTPEEIGIASLAAATATICHMLRDMGVATYISTAVKLTEADRRTCLGVAYVLSISAATVLSLASIPLSQFYKEPRLTQVMIVLALSMAISPAVAIRSSFLNREKKFASVSIFNVINIAAFFICSVTLALMGQSYMSVPYASLAAALTTTGAIGIRYGFGGFARVSLRGWRDLLSLSLWPFSIQLITSAADKSPEFSLARSHGFAASAFFEKSLTAVELSKRLIVDALQVLLHPRLRQVVDDRGLFRKECSDTFLLFFLVGFCIASVLSVVAHPVIAILFGRPWMRSGEILQTVAWIAPFSLGNYILIQILYYVIEPRTIASWTLFAKSTTMCTVIVSSLSGLQAIANAIVCIEIGVLLFGLILFRKHFDWSLLSESTREWGPVLGIPLVAVHMWREYGWQLVQTDVLRLISTSVIWLALFSLGTFLIRPKSRSRWYRGFIKGDH